MSISQGGGERDIGRKWFVETVPSSQSRTGRDPYLPRNKIYRRSGNKDFTPLDTLFERRRNREWTKGGKRGDFRRERRKNRLLRGPQWPADRGKRERKGKVKKAGREAIHLEPTTS